MLYWIDMARVDNLFVLDFNGIALRYIRLCLDGYSMMSVKSIWVMTSVSSLTSLLSFCLADLSSGDSRVLNSPTISVWGLMCDLSFSSVSLHMRAPLYLGHRCSVLGFPLDGVFLWLIWNVLFCLFWLVLVWNHILLALEATWLYFPLPCLIK